MDFLLTVYSLGLLNCKRYGCLSASCAVIRLFGLNCSILFRRSRASAGVLLLNHSAKGLGLGMVSDSSIVKATSLLSDYTSLLDGFPTKETILSS